MSPAFPRCIGFLGFLLACAPLGAQTPRDPSCPPRLPAVPGEPPATFVPCQVTTAATWALGRERVVYPAVLERAQVGGRVDVQFVIDSSGRVESTSFRVFKSPHDLFTDAARDAVVRGRATPARIDGIPVRQQVRHTFLFVLVDSMPRCGVPMLRANPDTTTVCGRGPR